ncbi:inner membrane protein YhjD [Pseudonocardia acidicola]|uniref:Inner membrane protein YhjD n=1 Tax=Pseudonocardia acidicola TaxID=2724939 RepID=A0ABX1SBX4_9PSEU|nr:inner membrane protein YhjD [Pseudonocardia acidicola]NMH99066.1 inner membrane protein YhjD [Pseudonocardia acidicola]
MAAPTTAVEAPARDGAEPAENKSKLEQLRDRYSWLDHVVRAGQRYTESHGDHYAAAITYFSVLSLVPLLMIAFAVAGFVLQSRPELVTELQHAITGAVPGELGTTLNGIIETAISQAGAVGAFGLLGALYSGIGWMSNLREALSEQWGQRSEPPNAVKKLIFDLLALIGLGLALVVSFGITAIGSGLGATVLRLVGLADQGWARAMLALFGLLLGIAANWLVFLWVIARLPREPVTLRSAAKAALLGAVGFEILKQVMTFYLGAVTKSPAGAAFGSILGLLIFAFFASRFLLFVTAWAATAKENEQEEPAPVPGPAMICPEVTVHSGPGAGAAVGLVGAGVLTGVLGVRLWGGRKQS